MKLQSTLPLDSIALVPSYSLRAENVTAALGAFGDYRTAPEMLEIDPLKP